jgi:predicted DNA repair protein MutK
MLRIADVSKRKRVNMAGSSFFALIDDIATLLDDVATMTKVAARKTAGVLGDDLALNAEQVSGVRADRELPVVWAVAKGSLVNKMILVPAALAISYFIPWLITPLLMLGGLYLCFEGFEKIAHPLLHGKEETKAHKEQLIAAVEDPSVDLVAFEQEKIKGAIRTDFILSAEIIVITLGTVAGATWGNQLAVLISIAIIITVGVYGIVAGIVKLDDLGLYLMRDHVEGESMTFGQAIGRFLLLAAPKLMKTLSIVGTAAMFMVGGGILAHGISAIHHWTAHAAEVVATWPVIGFLSILTPTLLDALLGVVAGAVVLAIITLGKSLFGSSKAAH